jgi:hypothetical protein
MIDIGPIFGPLDVAMLALIIGAPGLVVGGLAPLREGAIAAGARWSAPLAGC